MDPTPVSELRCRSITVSVCRPALAAVMGGVRNRDLAVQNAPDRSPPYPQARLLFRGRNLGVPGAGALGHSAAEHPVPGTRPAELYHHPAVARHLGGPDLSVISVLGRRIRIASHLPGPIPHGLDHVY